MFLTKDLRKVFHVLPTNSDLKQRLRASYTYIIYIVFKFNNEPSSI